MAVLEEEQRVAQQPQLNWNQWVDTMRDSTDEWVDRLLERRLILGVTGFSGSGKSTLLTSLIHQLRHFQNAQLSALGPKLRERLIGVELLEIPSSNLPRFPYEQGIASLASQPPRWPQPTEGISTILLELRCKPKRGVLSMLGRRYEKLYIEITDYPGEWLLDLPLLEMDYREWSIDSYQLFNKEPRKTLLGSLLDDLNRLDPLAKADEGEIFALHRAYVSFLKRCRAERLSVIQPGRFLLEDKGSRDLIAPFLPLPRLEHYPPDLIANPPRKSYLALMQKRYSYYRNYCVEPFYRNHFSRVHRHLVLVDVLQALNAGAPHLEDMQYGLTRVLNSFDYGQNSLIRRLFAPVVEKVIFVASKIDQVLPDQHENIRAFASAMVQEAYRRASYEQIDVHTEAVAAVRTTTTTTHQQKTVLKGQIEGGEGGVAGYLRHPDIPDHLPTESEWPQFRKWLLRRLLPPAGLQTLPQGGVLPHIRLDSVIRELIGDKL